MEAMGWKRLRIVVPVVVVIACLINAAAGAFTTRPPNAIGEVGTAFSFPCVDDTGTINWIYDNDAIIGDGCSSTAPQFTPGAGGSNTDCTLIVHGNSTSRLSGPFTCSTGTNADQNTEAVAVVIDPAATCGITSTEAVLQGSTVTLTCTMTYYIRSMRGLRPKADFAAVIGWDQNVFPGGTSSSNTLSDDGVQLTVAVDYVVPAAATEVPAAVCTSTFSFTGAEVTSMAAAGNQLTWPCNHEASPVWYCPTSVTITASDGTNYKTGDVLFCTSDGYPTPSFEWTNTLTGASVGSGNLTLTTGGQFDYTCTGTITQFSPPCSNNANISGYAIACPENLAADPSVEVIFGATITCSSTGGSPDPTYQWLDETGNVLSTSATVTAPATSGTTFNYTCVATVTDSGRSCVVMQSFPGTTVSETTSTSTTTTDYTGTGTLETTTAGDTSLFKLLTIVFSVLIGLGLLWILLLFCCLYVWYPPGWRRRVLVRRRYITDDPYARYDQYNRGYPPVRSQRPFPPYSNVFSPGTPGPMPNYY